MATIRARQGADGSVGYTACVFARVFDGEHDVIRWHSHAARPSRPLLFSLSEAQKEQSNMVCRVARSTRANVIETSTACADRRAEL